MNSRLALLNLISFVTGYLSRLQLPTPIQWACNAIFVTVFKIDMEEAEKPLINYASIEEVFTRSLKKEARKNDESFLISPAEGKISQMGLSVKGQAVQVKGLNYSLSELVYSANKEPLNNAMNLVWFSTVYLAPHNYHQVHAPVSGKVTNVRYIPGTLWPVNKPLVKHMPRLFLQNERMVFDIMVENGGVVHVVMVGALNVGRMTTPLLPGFSTNSPGKAVAFDKEVSKDVVKGEPLGVFMLGSTVVTVFDELASSSCNLPDDFHGEKVIRVGDSLLLES